MAGLRNEATLALKISLSNSRGVESVRKDLQDLAQVFRSAAFAKQADVMEQSIKDLQAETKKLKRELDAANKSSANGAKTTAAAILGANAKVINQNKRLEDGLRAKDALNRQMAHNHVLDYQRIEAANKKKAQTDKAAADAAKKAGADQRRAAKEAADAFLASATKQQNAIDALAAEKKKAATASRTLSAAEQVLKNVQREGGDFALKNRAAIIRLTKAMDAGDDRTIAYARSLQLAVDSNRALDRALNRQSFTVTANGKAWKFQLSTMQQLRENFSEMEHRMDALFRASLRLNLTGMTLRRWGENIFRFGVDIMNTFGEFEYTMLRAAGALEIWRTDLDETSVGFGVLQEKILGAAKEMRLFASEEVAEALYFWGSATGQVVDNVEDLDTAFQGLNAIMQTAAMTNTGYEDTIKGVYSILTQFYGGSLEEAEAVTQKLFFTTQKTAAEFTDLIQSFKMVGPVAAQVGADFDEVNEIFGTLSDLGLRGSQAGRGLRQMFIQLARPSGPAQNAINALWESIDTEFTGGKTFIETMFPEGEFIGITEYMDKLARATMNLTAQERLSFLARISTANMLPLMTALVAKQRNEILGLVEAEDKWLDADTKYVEFFENNWMALSESWKGVIGGLQRTIESLKITLGSMLADVLAPLVEMFNQFIVKIEEFIKTHPDIVRFGQQLAVIAAVGLVVSGVVLTALGAFIGLAAAIYLVWNATNQWALQITGFVAIIGGLAAAIVRNYDAISSKLRPAISDIIEAFQRLSDNGTDVVDVFEAIITPVQELFDTIVLTAADVIAAVARLANEFSKWEHAGEIVSTLAKIIGVLIASRILVGIGRVAIAVTGLGRAFVALRGAASAAAAARGALMLLMGGLPGLIAAATVALITFGDEIPFVSDILSAFGGRNVTAAEKVAQLTDALGDQGEAFAKLAEVSIDYDALLVQVTQSAKEAREQAQQAARDALEQPIDLESDTNYAQQYVDAVWATNAVESDQYIKDAEAQVDEIKAQALHYYKVGLDELNRSLESVGLSGTTESGWFETLQELMLAGITDPYTQSYLAQRIIEKVRKTPVFNETDALDFYEALIGDKFPELTPAEFRALGILDAGIGDLSSGQAVVDDEFYNSLVEAMGFDAEKLNEFMTTEIEAFGEIPVDILQRSDITGPTREILKVLASRWAEQQGLALEQLDSSSMANRIKEGFLMMAENTFQAALGPATMELIAVIDENSLGTPQNMEAIADALMSDLGDGTTWIDALSSGGVPEDVKKAVIDGMQYMVDNGLAHPEIMAFLESQAGDAGEEAGETAKKSFRDRLLESLGSEMGVSKEDFVKALKKGSLAKQAREGFAEFNKLIKWTNKRGGGLSPQAAAMRRDIQKQSQDMQTIIIETFQRRGKNAQARRATRQAVMSQFENWGSMTKEEKRKALKWAQGLELNASVQQGIIKSIKPGKLRKRLLMRLFGGGAGDSGAGDSGDATATVESNPILKGLVGMIEAIPAGIEASEGQGFIATATAIWDGMSTAISEYAAPGVDEAVSTVLATIGGEDGATWTTIQSIAETIARRAHTTLSAEIPKAPGPRAIGDAGTLLVEQGLALVDVTKGRSVGISLAQAIADGINVTIGAIETALNAVRKITEGGSPPEAGPLKNIDKGGFNIGKAWADGMAQGIRSGRSAFDGELRGYTGTDIAMSHKKEITVKLEVSSPDGTVDRQKQAEIRRGAMEALTAAGLEHYVTIS